MKVGRPTDYTSELGIEICDKIASRCVGIRQICNENPHFPNPDTIYVWIRKHKEFAERYAQAKKDQVFGLVDEILDISDDSSRDNKTNNNGDVVCDSEWVARSRLRVDTRKWIAAKLVPRIYGDNALARELADEIDEFRKMLEAKNIRRLNSGEVNSGEAEEDSEE